MDVQNALLWLECHINLILTIIGFLLAWYTYCREVKNELVVKLAKQVIAYYSLEQEAIKEIQKTSQESAKTIKVRLRNAAKYNQENLEGEYPSMTAKAARKYVN
jgi:NADH:ubiquinone oxidoreductase subunit 5 (subunit L)/multisubunit Na+/H+ antiporter MnhA subunit